MEWLAGQGFEVVEYRIVTADNLDEAMDYFADQVKKNDFPSDGLVALYDDIAYGDSLGSTAKFPRNSYAFKWADEIFVDYASGNRMEPFPDRTDQSGGHFRSGGAGGLYGKQGQRA